MRFPAKHRQCALCRGNAGACPERWTWELHPSPETATLACFTRAAQGCKRAARILHMDRREGKAQWADER